MTPLTLLPLLAALTATPPAATETTAAAQGSPESTWGVTAVALHPTFGGHMLDFRYRVVDAAKAKPLFGDKVKTYLYDPATGAAVGLPGDTSIGQLRASVHNPPVTGKQYFVLFSNAYGQVKHGDRVTVVLGDCRFDDVQVE